MADELIPGLWAEAVDGENVRLTVWGIEVPAPRHGEVELHVLVSMREGVPHIHSLGVTDIVHR